MDDSVVVFQSTSKKSNKPTQQKPLPIKPPSTAPRNLREVPAQHEPHVQQEKAQPDQHKAIRRIARRRPPAHLPRAPIAAFDPKAPTVQAPRTLRRQFEVNQDENEPRRSPRH